MSEFLKYVLAVVGAVLLVVVLAGVAYQLNPPQITEAPVTTLELSKDGEVTFAKVPAGANVHVIVSDGKLLDVRLVDTSIAFQ